MYNVFRASTGWRQLPNLRKIGSIFSRNNAASNRPQSSLLDRLRQGPLVDDLHELFRSETADSERNFTPLATSDSGDSKPTPGRPWAIIRQVPVYTYTPLKSKSAFHLLRVTKGLVAPFQKSIHIELAEFPLGEAAPRYEALSYRWSSSAGTQDIKCNDKQFLITDSCKKALEYLRSQHCWLWVDLICIDQNNISEKGHQVRLMSQIYVNAQRTIVWLGEDADIDSNCLADIGSAVSRLSRPPVKRLNPVDPWLRGKVRTPPASVDRFFRREWFSRIWILQEIALAKEVLSFCGAQLVSWKKCSAFLETLRKQQRLPLAWRSANNLMRFCSLYQSCRVNGGVDIAQALFQARACDASDPRDKVYALYGVCRALATS